MDLFNLRGKTALVIGASSGLGLRFAQTLANAQAKVIIAARRKALLDDLAKQMSLNGNEVTPLEIDISNKESIKQALTDLFKNERVDILVNDAALAKPTPIFEEDNEDMFASIINTNILGVWYTTKIIANHMKEHNIEGSIINISSVNGESYMTPNFAGYAISKAAVIHLTKALVTELSKFRIRINTIVPGLFHTPLTDYKLNTEEAKKKIEGLIPLSFVGIPSDLDATILYLASNKASRYVTGSCITVDGGISWGG
jgi:NAD(P)-dependent dehydrogenase (short-subunit alcohol dehydrogenase family)